MPTNDKTTDNNTNHPGACIIIDSPQPQITLMTGGGTLRVSYPKLGGTTDRRLPTNDKTTNRPPSIPVKPWCPQVTGPRHHNRQTDRRTNCMYVCMYVFPAMTKCSIINLNIFWWGKWTSLPPLGIVSTALCESFSIVFDRWIVSELLKKCQTCFRMISNVSEVFEWFQMFQKFSNDFKCFRSFQMLLR